MGNRLQERSLFGLCFGFGSCHDTTGKGCIECVWKIWPLIYREKITKLFSRNTISNLIIYFSDVHPGY